MSAYVGSSENLNDLKDFADLIFSRSAVRTVEPKSDSEGDQEEEGGEEEERVGGRDP